MFDKFQLGSRRLENGQVGSRRFEKVHEYSIISNKVQDAFSEWKKRLNRF